MSVEIIQRAPRAFLLAVALAMLVACDRATDGADPSQALPALAPGPVIEPVQLGMCAACHWDQGRDGAVGTPRLAGQDGTYLAASLRAYRDGDRNHSAMRAISGALSNAEIDAFARWYAAQPACAESGPAGADPALPGGV